MDVLQGLTDTARQTFVFIAENQAQVTMNLYYMESQMSWFFDIIFDDFVASGLKLVLAPNLLRPFQNVLPFGLQVFTLNEADTIEPIYVNDFSSQRVNIGILSNEEVQQISQLVYLRD